MNNQLLPLTAASARLIAPAANAATGGVNGWNFGIDNLSFTGDINAIPEPSPFALVGPGALAHYSHGAVISPEQCTEPIF